MTAITKDVEELFDNTIHKIKEDLRQLMSELWVNWTHLGVDMNTKISNINKFIQIEKDFHNEVMTETRLKMSKLQEIIESLKTEADELSKYLSVNIELNSMKENGTLIEYKMELEDQIAEYRQQMEQRKMKMDRLVEWQQDLSEKLGVAIPELQEMPLPSEEELDQLQLNLELLQAERDKRVETFLYTQVEIKNIMDKLQIKPQSKFEQMVISSLSVDFKVTDMNMDRLAQIHQDLQEKYKQTNNRVLELREQLAKLWECLEEDQIYRESFLQAHPGCSPPTEAALKEEINRCEEIKLQKISVFVANVRTKIKLMWDDLMYSNEQRQDFRPYYEDNFTEDTLTLHEMYLKKITRFYEDHRDIYQMLTTRESLWRKMIELEARASAPGRYNNRGGQLLQEERDRKAISSSLPNVEAQIRARVLQYEEESGNQFTINGKSLLQTLRDDWEKRKTDRQIKLSARKQALTPTTSSYRSMAISPLGKRNRTAAGLTPVGDNNRPTTKRQLLTGSATKASSAFTPNRSVIKRSAITSIKRRLSGRLAAREKVTGRKLKYPEDQPRENNAKIIVNGTILKHKRTSRSRLSKQRSTNINQVATAEASSSEAVTGLAESTMLTTYTDFRDDINKKQVSRSSVVHHGEKEGEKTSVKVETPNAALRNACNTPRAGKENGINPSNLLQTPTRLTRSASQLKNDGFVTPRTPLASKNNIVKQNITHKLTPNNITRSKSQTNIIRAKNLPPII